MTTIISYGKLPLTKFQLNANMARLYWNITDNDSEYTVFQDTKQHLTVVSKSDENLKSIRNNTFYVNQILGYTQYSLRDSNGKETKSYLHKLLMEKVPQPSEKHNTVDHINQIKTDNRMCNLRWASQSEQNENTRKRARNKSARELPDEIKDVQLPKYVIYYYAKATDQHYFQIEKHPKLEGKRPKTTKSRKISITDKLEQAKQMLKDLGTSEEETKFQEKRQGLLESYNRIINAVNEWLLNNEMSNASITSSSNNNSTVLT